MADKKQKSNMSSNSHDPMVFAVVINRNGKKRLLGTLSSLFMSGYPRLEVVLVDNDSEDGSLELARRSFPRMTLIKNDYDLGLAAANNLGIKYALSRSADYVFLVKNGVELAPGAIRSLVRMAQSDPAIGVVGAVISTGNGAMLFARGKIDWLRMKTEESADLPEGGFSSVDFASSRAMLVRAEVFERIDLLNEDYFMCLEDVDLCARAKKAGFRVAMSDASRAIQTETEQNLPKKEYWEQISKLIFFKNNGPASLRMRITSNKLINKLRGLAAKKQQGRSGSQKAWQDFGRL